MREVPVHYLRPNETVWTPPSVIFWDTESRWVRTETEETHRLRLWVACRVDRRSSRKQVPEPLWGHGEDPGSLAAWVDAQMVGRDCVWMYAHNLNFDLSVSALPDALGDLGWSVTEFSMAGGAPWIRFGRKRKTLTVCDSWNWLPKSLGDVAAAMGRRKEDLPAPEDGIPEWLTRCGTDVALLGEAVLSLMAWWDTERLGRWTISGAASGWNAMRHVATQERHVIDVTPELVAQDRSAVRGGRKDAAVIRSADGGPWVELDFTAAYPTIARDCLLPLKRGWTFDSLPLDSRWLRSRLWAPVAECEIETDHPRYPVRHDHVTWYPVGRFRTTLAAPEISEALARGELRAVGPGQMHQMGLALRPWATWVLDPARGGETYVPPVGYIAAKAWGRSVIGKFAARGHVSERLPGDAPDGWLNEDSWNAETRSRAGDVTFGGSRWYVTYDGDTENCYPAVLAFVESHVRVRLGRVLDRLDGLWWTCDTDGMLVDMSRPIPLGAAGLTYLAGAPGDVMGYAEAICAEMGPLVAPLKLRVKKVVHSLAVLGPQHMTVDGTRRMAGVQGDAEEVEPGRYVGYDWPRIKWQMERGLPGVYVRPARRMTFAGPTVHRWVLADGTTRPVEMTVGSDGGNQLLPWAGSRWSAPAVDLAPVQYQRLARIV